MNSQWHHRVRFRRESVEWRAHVLTPHNQLEQGITNLQEGDTGR